MSISLFLAGWEAEGLRCPDHSISFESAQQDVFQISLVQMPNGTGKTTTLTLLRATLSGAVASGAWTAQKIRSFAKRGNETGAGAFRVRLLINGRLTTLCLNFDFDQGTALYTTTLASGMKNGFHPPQGAEKFLVEEFVNFFVFDGELAEHLLSSEFTDAQVVIENLFQLSLFGEVKRAVGDYYDRRTAGRAQDERGYTRRRNRVDSLRGRIETLRADRTIAVSRYESVRKSLAQHKETFEHDLEKARDHGEKVKTALTVLSEATSTVNRTAQEVLARMRDPQALSAVFANETLQLKTSLDRVKLPESTAREFFEELAEEDICVCGRVLDDEHKQAIRERATKYLGSEDVAFLNTLKGDVANQIGVDAASHELDLDARISRLVSGIRVEEEAKTAYNTLEADAIADDPSLQDAKKLIDDLEKQLERLEGSKQKYESADDSLADENTFGIKILERRLEDAETKLAEIADTINLRKKREVLNNILQAALQAARAGISAEITNQTNDRLAEVIPNNEIRVERIERCLVLRGQDAGSAGETLSVAYAFLATLFNRVDHRLPFIADSPAGPLDLRVRTKVAELIPKLTQQFVALTISTERQGFVAPLAAACDSPLQYITLFRRGPADLEARASAHNADFTQDGVLVHGQEFFTNFDLETEDS